MKQINSNYIFDLLAFLCVQASAKPLPRGGYLNSYFIDLFFENEKINLLALKELEKRFKVKQARFQHPNNAFL